MKKVFIIHDWQGTPNGSWKPWLMEELAKKNVYACTLPMPNADFPSVDEWVEEISRVTKENLENIILVGHSLGVPAILHYLQNLEIGKSIGGCVLVSGPIHPLLLNQYRTIDNFLDTNFDFEKIKKTCPNFSVIHGDDDSAVPFSHAIELSGILSCKLVSIKNGGHLSVDAGIFELPEALKALEEMMK